MRGIFGVKPGLGQLERIGDAQGPRGPDDSGMFSYDHGRPAPQPLSVIDLEGDHQPMTMADGRRTLASNGQPCNYLALRSESRARSKTPDGPTPGPGRSTPDQHPAPEPVR